MKKIYYNKLIRDSIPERIRESGADFGVKELSDEEFEKELVKKVEEEASALPKARTKEELVSELGDVLDVIDEIKKLKGISEEELAASRAKEFERKGGFAKRLFLFWTTDSGYRSNEKRNA